MQEQAGIYAGEGGFDIEVDGNTDLKGAVIASEADAVNNRISTGTLTYSDLENKAEYEANTVGINLNHSFDNGKDPGNAQKPYEVQTPPDNKDKGVTPNMAGSDGEASSITKSAIAEGEIEIRDNPDQDISDLSRDTGNANNPLNPIFDRDKVLEKQEAAAVFGEIAYTIVGKIGEDWDANDPRKVALHALVGGIMADINGGKFGDGMTVGAINELIIGNIVKSMEDSLKKGEMPAISPEQVQWISAILGASLYDEQGSAIAGSGTKNNAFGDHYWKLYKAVVVLTSKIESVKASANVINYGTEQERRTYNFGDGDVVTIGIGHGIRDTHAEQVLGSGDSFKGISEEHFVNAILQSILINDAIKNLPSDGSVKELTTYMAVFNEKTRKNDVIILGFKAFKDPKTGTLHIPTFYPKAKIY